MKILLLNFILLFFLTPSSAGQADTWEIRGVIKTTSNEVIPYATVSLLDVDGKLTMGTISGENGKFQLDNVAFNSYVMEISFLGYHTYSKEIQMSKDNKKAILTDLILTEDGKMLDEVEITAEKSQYTLKMDKKVFNVGKDVLAQGGNALDVLDQVPQVSVQPSGAVELRGSSAVQILINGRRSGLTMNNALDQLEIENIDKIEVITNPSARYDASGSAGIINIILKKNKGEGLKGQIRATTGTPVNHILMPGASYKNKKINLFTNIRWRYSDYNGRYSIDQENFGDNPFTLTSNEVEDRHDDGLSIYTGGDYSFSDKSSLTLAYFRANTKDTDHTELEYELTDNISTQDLKRIGNSLERRNYNQLEVQFHQDFNKKGQKLNLNLQYDFWNSEKAWDLTTEADILPENIAQSLRTNNLAGSKDLVISGDLDWPILGGSLATGLKWENRKVDNEYLAENQENQEWSVYRSIDNDVDYREMISAAYIDYSRSFQKLQVKLGLRAEQTNIEIDDAEAIYSDTKDYLNFFPSAFLSYPISENVEIQSGYSRRINRPSLWDLYPFNELTDINVVDMGNPDLDPSFTHGVESSVSIRSEKISINPGIYFRKNTDAMETFVIQGEDGFFTTIPVNIGDLDEMGVELNARYRPMSLLSFNLDFNYYTFDQSGSYNGRDLSAEGNVWRSRINSNLRLKNDLRVMASFQYRGPRKTAQIEYLASSDLSVSLSKSFFDNKFEVSVRGSNLLDTRNWISITEDPDFRIERKSRRTGPRFGLNMTYKFNYGKRDRMRTQNRGNR